MTEAPQGPAEFEIAKARRLLESAAYSMNGGFHEDVVSRAYYAVFHAGCALLASIGRTARTHDGLRSAVGEHFIRPGKLPPRFARLLSRIAADRNDADYSCLTTFTAEDAVESVAHAREFVSAVEAVLAERG